MHRLIVHNYLVRDAGSNGVCFACGRRLGSKASPKEVWTADPQMQWVGSECYGLIRSAGAQGYQPPKGGPRLFASKPTSAQIAKARTWDTRRPYDPGHREYTGREPIAAVIKNHPGVQEVEISQDSDYKYEVFLREGWCWKSGRNAGGRTGFFHNVSDFRYANPVKSAECGQ